jgi:hypothetical protein
LFLIDNSSSLSGVYINGRSYEFIVKKILKNFIGDPENESNSLLYAEGAVLCG